MLGWNIRLLLTWLLLLLLLLLIFFKLITLCSLFSPLLQCSPFFLQLLLPLYFTLVSPLLSCILTMLLVHR